MPKEAMKPPVVGPWSLVLGLWSSCFLRPSSFILLIWVIALGGAVGSFVNVVVYRLPRGMSLIRPGSHCPACKRPIRARDNIPILGWFLLRGRCRDCKEKIAFRYPLVEAITAGTLLALWLVEGIWLGRHLPQGPIASSDGSSARWLSVLLIRVSYHLVLLGTLLAAGLMEYDGHRVPLRLGWPALAIGALVPLGWAGVGPAPALVGWPNWIAELAGGAAGLAAGALLGFVAWYTIGPRDRLGLVLGPACVGLFLGWQAAAVLGFLAGLMQVAATALGRKWPAVRRPLPTLGLAAATLAWILIRHDVVRMPGSCGIL
jgi:leader peptidase (prepilin peptidase)/N-methyltransferase